MLGLEAQQRYSTGYIQCMHEVHNMLLTCDWMDKNLGSRLLNHLLKSLPRSSDERALQPSTGAHLPPPVGSSNGVALPASLLRADSHSVIHQDRASLQSPHIGQILDMWRPWWTVGYWIFSVLLDYALMYLIDMLFRKKHVFCLCSSDGYDYCRCAVKL